MILEYIPGDHVLFFLSGYNSREGRWTPEEWGLAKRLYDRVRSRVADIVQVDVSYNVDAMVYYVQMSYKDDKVSSPTTSIVIERELDVLVDEWLVPGMLAQLGKACFGKKSTS